MAATVRDTVTQLLESTRDVIDQLLALPIDEIPMPSSHTCAQGKDLWALITNDIDHETIHAGQVLEARYEARSTASPMERLVGEWLVARAKFIATFVGMDDDEFNAETVPGGWTYRGIAKHLVQLDQDSLKTVHKDVAARAAP
ncbi:MAG: hypothetical protein AB7N24_15630 [Dehalococcoidia bacterium]